jgi:serine phosphatase RsbU (regulator of sigma subunit)
VGTYEEAISELLEASHRIHPEHIVPMLAKHLPRLGMEDIGLYLADLEQRELVPVPGAGQTAQEPLSIDGTIGGRAFRSETPIDGSDGGDPSGTKVRLWVPLVDGAERLGVLAVTVDRSDDRVRQRARNAATIAAAMVVGKQPYGDQLVLVRRRKDMDLAAELRWDSLPPLTYVDDRVAISGRLEPAYEIAGDAFDYAVNGDFVHLAILDAMGHGLEASRMANLGVAVYRNTRRRGVSLEGLFTSIDQVVAAVFGLDTFITGQLAALNTLTGRLRWVNAGHPRPMVLRGNTTIDVPTEPCMPFGLGDVPSSISDLALEPGDTVLFFTDGVPEARSKDGEVFGRARLAELLVRTTAVGDPLAETARKLCHAVLAHQEDRLQDDATLLLLQWNGAR